MRRFVKHVVALGLVSGAIVGLQSSPAAAHNPNPYAAWACGGTRPDANYTLAHSHPVTLTTEYLLAHCEAWYEVNNALVFCDWDAYLLADGTPFGPLNGYDCRVIFG